MPTWSSNPLIRPTSVPSRSFQTTAMATIEVTKGRKNPTRKTLRNLSTPWLRPSAMSSPSPIVSGVVTRT